MLADAEGAPVYAAFCAISERILHPALARPGAMVTIASRLRRLSPKRLVSFHGLSIGDTLFADMHKAWDNLPAALRNAVEGRFAAEYISWQPSALRRTRPNMAVAQGYGFCLGECNV